MGVECRLAGTVRAVHPGQVERGTGARGSPVWEQMLAVLQPSLVVTAGAVAREVIRPVWPAERQLCLQSSSPLAMGSADALRCGLLRRFAPHGTFTSRGLRTCGAVGRPTSAAL